MRMLRGGRWITVVGLVLLAGVYVRALAYTPVEQSQGLAQKIFYLHVPAAIWAELAMVFVGLASVFYLFTKAPRLDRFAAASAEVCTVFCAIVLTTGPIWGKPIWGTWWTWDARLTFTLFLFLLYVGYLLLRGAVPDPAARARFAAVLGICGMCEVPFIHLSVYMFPTLHPMPIVLKPGAPSLPGSMLSTWLFSLGVFTLLYVGFVVQRYALSLLWQERNGARGPTERRLPRGGLRRDGRHPARLYLLPLPSVEQGLAAGLFHEQFSARLREPLLPARDLGGPEVEGLFRGPDVARLEQGLGVEPQGLGAAPPCG